MRVLTFSLSVLAALTMTTISLLANNQAIPDRPLGQIRNEFNSNKESKSALAIQEYIPDPFLSFWAPGAPEGILTMDFDSPLMDDGKTWVQIGWGNPQGEGEYYFEKIMCTIDGNRLSADLTGKLRTPALMTPKHPDASYSSISISVINVRDEDGDYVASPGQGTAGSYHYIVPYLLINQTNLVAEFSPASGSSIEDVKSVNVWMSGLKSSSFEGFDLTVTSKDNVCSNIFIPLSEVKVTWINENESEYDFEIPEDLRENAKRIMIRLGGVRSLDGYSHAHDVKCIYGGMIVNSVIPRNGESLAILDEGEKVSMRNNLSGIYPNLYVECRILDITEDSDDSVLLESSPMIREKEGTYYIESPKELILYEDHEYAVEFTAWIDKTSRFDYPEDSLGTDFVVWKGASANYCYSDIRLWRITPSPDVPLEKGTGEITLIFEGSVVLGNGNASEGELQTYILSDSGMKVPFDGIVAVDPINVDRKILSGEWKLILPDHYNDNSESTLTIRFTAFDQDGLIVKGNEGVENNSYFSYTWADGGESLVPSFGPDLSVTIYNLSGLPIVKGNRREVMKNLPKGFYIVNGRKVIINR